jgi:hypothetical protein
MKMGAAHTRETPIAIHQVTQHDIQEESNLWFRVGFIGQQCFSNALTEEQA